MIKPQSIMNTPARLIIADDHELARAGLRAMLESDQSLSIIGEATTGVAAVALCKEVQPDLALLDVRMPEMDGLTAARAIQLACPQTRVLIMTIHESPDYLLAAIKAGAAGYVLKDITRHELLSTVRRVLRGESVLNSDIAARTLYRLVLQPVRPSDVQSDQLTPRECDVLVQMVKGRTNRQIGEVLSISSGTAKIHVGHIIAKLGASDRTQAAVRAIETGLVRSEEP